MVILLEKLRQSSQKYRFQSINKNDHLLFSPYGNEFIELRKLTRSDIWLIAEIYASGDQYPQDKKQFGINFLWYSIQDSSILSPSGFLLEFDGEHIFKKPTSKSFMVWWNDLHQDSKDLLILCMEHALPKLWDVYVNYLVAQKREHTPYSEQEDEDFFEPLDDEIAQDFDHHAE